MYCLRASMVCDTPSQLCIWTFQTEYKGLDILFFLSSEEYAICAHFSHSELTINAKSNNSLFSHDAHIIFKFLFKTHYE